MATVRLAGVVALLGLIGCQTDYTMSAIQEPSVLDDFACDRTADEAATDEERPIAVCEASALQIDPIHESANFYGANSYDPNGHALIGYDWSLDSAPDGSAATLGITRDANVFGFVPDLVGTYSVSLVVVNDQCVQSDPCEVQIEALPDEDLWIELTWDHPGDDMDLHVMRNNAAPTSNGDCYYANCVGGSLDWGAPGVSTDDPHLDLDDIPGTGPENINVYDPAEGVYHVAVHDYPGTVYNGDNRVRVRIYAGGVKVYEDTKTIAGEDRLVPFADIAWPSGEIVRR